MMAEKSMAGKSRTISLMLVAMMLFDRLIY
jgi:hypothetical protein